MRPFAGSAGVQTGTPRRERGSPNGHAPPGARGFSSASSPGWAELGLGVPRWAELGLGVPRGRLCEKDSVKGLWRPPGWGMMRLEWAGRPPPATTDGFAVLAAAFHGLWAEDAAERGEESPNTTGRVAC